MSEKLLTSNEYVRSLDVDLDQVARWMLTEAFKAGVKEGRRRQQGYLARLISKGRYDETELPVPEHDGRLPGYHALLGHLCDELRVCGAVTFWQAVENVKKRLGDR